MKKTKKNVVNKDVVKSRVAHASAVPRMEPKAKNAGLRSKANKTQVRKPKKAGK
jgi:hypothetical protein